MSGVSLFMPVDVSALVEWVSAIPFEEWPQQHRLDDGKIRPAMVTDLAWHGFGLRTDAIVNSLTPRISLVKAWHSSSNRMLSVVMPGHSIPSHRDEQEPRWVTRVHVPLTTNDKSIMIMGGYNLRLKVGSSYLVDTREMHAIHNDGDTPRIHFMFDVRS